MSQTAAPNVAFIFDCDGTLVNSTPVSRPMPSPSYCTATELT